MTETVKVFGFGDSDRSGKVRWVARELGLEIEEAPVAPGDHFKSAYTSKNPYAQIPTAVFRGRTLVESTAICHNLAEAFDEPRLWVGRGEPERETYLHWLAVFGETMEGRLVECAISLFGIIPPEYFALHEKALRRKLAVAASQLPQEGYLCGERFTVADILAGYNLRLAVQCKLIERTAVDPYLGRLVERPAAQESRVFAGFE